MENFGHLAGMLDRDQRTAKLRFFSDKEVEKTYSFPEKAVNESNANPNSIISHHHCWCPTRTKSSKPSYLPWKNGYLLKSFHRLTNVLIVSVYLTLVTLPSTNSAPTNLKMSERMNGPRKWINPCGFPIQDTNNAGSSDTDGLRAKDLERIIGQAQITLTKAETFRHKFADKTFGMPFDAVQKLFEDQSAKFLKLKLPKSLGGEIPMETLDTLTIEKALLDSYEYLQRVAVGLEQVTWDQEDNQAPFAEDFANREDELRNLLCELQMAIIAQGTTITKDVDRDEMDENKRHLNKTETQARDWLIFREYMNTLEYIEKAFTHLKGMTV